MLTDRLEQALARVRRRERMFAVLFVDLDRFKTVNDTLGHTVGDQLLIEAAARIQAAVRETDTVARLGGDEFVVLCEDIEGVHQAADFAERIITSLEAPFHFGTDESRVQREHRHGALGRRHRTRRCDPRQRRHRDVPRQGQRPQSLRVVRRSDADVGDHPGRARSRAALRGAPQRVAPLLSAVHRGRHRTRPRLRGAAALGTPGLRSRCARRVHRDGRRGRAHARDRQLGARGSVPARGRVVAAMARTPTRHLGELVEPPTALRRRAPTGCRCTRAHRGSRPTCSRWRSPRAR